MKNNKLLKISGVLLILYVVAFSAYLIVTNNGYSGNAHIPIGNILASSLPSVMISLYCFGLKLTKAEYRTVSLAPLFTQLCAYYP